MLSECLTPANVNLDKEKFYFALSHLDTHLGGFRASFCFSGGRQDARLSLGFLWEVLEWG